MSDRGELEQLRDLLKLRFRSGRSVSVSREAFYTRSIKDEIYTEYTITVSPGLQKRYSHQTFVGNTLQECVEKLDESAKAENL